MTPITATSEERNALFAGFVIGLNACESAELSPFLYDGWVPFLLSRGARGVLGTEVETPAFFAAEFAKEFVKRFTAGDVALAGGLGASQISALTTRNYAVYDLDDARTRLLRFTDDVEFSLDEAAGVIHVRSASRLGYGDRGVNRARVEAIRSAFMASPAGLQSGAGAAR